MAIKIDGLPEISDRLPDEGWYSLRIVFRRVRPGEAEVRFDPQLERVRLADVPPKASKEQDDGKG